MRELSDVARTRLRVAGCGLDFGARAGEERGARGDRSERSSVRNKSENLFLMATFNASTQGKIQRPPSAGIDLRFGLGTGNHITTNIVVETKQT